MHLLEITTEAGKKVFINPISIMTMTEMGATMHPANEPPPIRTRIDLQDGSYEIAVESLLTLRCSWREAMVQETFNRSLL